MKLTSHCKQDFENWLENKHNLHSTEWQELNKTCQNALIIEFFDSVGIKILIDTLYFQNWFFYKIKKNVELIEDVKMYKTRTEAINQAIIKANDLFNENN